MPFVKRSRLARGILTNHVQARANLNSSSGQFWVKIERKKEFWVEKLSRAWLSIFCLKSCFSFAAAAAAVFFFKRPKNRFKTFSIKWIIFQLRLHSIKFNFAFCNILVWLVCWFWGFKQRYKWMLKISSTNVVWIIF